MKTLAIVGAVLCVLFFVVLNFTEPDPPRQPTPLESATPVVFIDGWKTTPPDQQADFIRERGAAVGLDAQIVEQVVADFDAGEMLFGGALQMLDNYRTGVN